jgi:hypothetical protein
VAAGVSRRFHAIGLAMAGMALALVSGGCGPASQNATPEPTASVPIASISPVVALTQTQVERALSAAGLALIEARVPFRPPEPPDLMAVPRAVFQAVLPADPAHGYIVVYQLRDEATAATAGRELADYLASGYGRTQFPPDAKHVLRQLQTTLISFSWSPADSPDPNTSKIADALQTVGTPIDVPR